MERPRRRTRSTWSAPAARPMPSRSATSVCSSRAPSGPSPAVWRIERLGVAAPFILSATMAAVAAACLVAGGARARRERPAPHLVPSFSRSMTLITRNRRVALIALIVVLAEVLGFSSITVYPTFARDVLGSDAAGLGRARDGEADRRDRGAARPRPAGPGQDPRGSHDPRRPARVRAGPHGLRREHVVRAVSSPCSWWWGRRWQASTP